MFAAALIMFSACEIVTFEEYALLEYDGDLLWTEVINDADWSNRLDHDATVFENKMWVSGGYNPGRSNGDPYYEDVWSSTNGESWELVTDNAPWKGRRGHRMITFNDGSGEAMYLIGGFEVDEETGYRQYANDVWKSIDGVNWTEIKPKSDPSLNSTTDWFPRMHHQVVVANHGGTNYIYILAGRSMDDSGEGRYAVTYLNDVWRSTDGMSWQRITGTDFGIRAEHAAVVDSSGKIYIHGGSSGIGLDDESNGADPISDWQAVWSSTDGTNWVPAKDSSENVADMFFWRGGHEMIYYHGKVWALPGKTTSTVHYHFVDRKYYSIWTLGPSGFEMDSEGAAVDGRHSYASVVFNDKIWILGGYTNKQGQANDVWSGSIN